MLPATSGAQSSDDLPSTGTPLLWTPLDYVLFDFVPVGGSSTRPLPIINGGDAPLRIRDLGFIGPAAGDFHVASDTCRGESVAAHGGRCQINIAFAPTATGTRAGTIKITQDSGCMNWIGVAGSATGAAASAAALPRGPVAAKAASSCPTDLPVINVTKNVTIADSQIALPAARTCKSRRIVTVRLPKPRKGSSYKQVSALLNGKRIKVVKGSRISARIDLRGLPRGRFTLKLTIVPTSGRKVTSTRHYVTCVKA
jgi:hypothetical protein